MDGLSGFQPNENQPVRVYKCGLQWPGSWVGSGWNQTMYRATTKDSFHKANQSSRIQEDINRERSAELNDSALCPCTILLSSIYIYDTEIHKYYENI
jgi:hypothetical protein